jgi:hypothetical protein
MAAWYSLVAPFVAGLTSMIFLENYPYRSSKPETIPTELDILGIALLVCMSSTILGAISLLGIHRHGKRVILWKAVTGILSSCVFGLILFAAAIMVYGSGLAC